MFVILAIFKLPIVNSISWVIEVRNFLARITTLASVLIYDRDRSLCKIGHRPKKAMKPELKRKFSFGSWPPRPPRLMGH